MDAEPTSDTWTGGWARVGEPAPDFSLLCVDATGDQPQRKQLGDYAGRWLMLVFYPRDFSFVCPTELTAFSARQPDFERHACGILGISVDSLDLHREWLRTPPADGGLGPLQYPLASDPDGAAARAYGVWVPEKGVSTRGLFIIDPQGLLQYAVVHNLSVGRSPDEVLRVLDALQTGGLCPASWTSADGTIDPERALQPGRILGHYRIRRHLGGGTFGSVFAAWDLRLERMVALKVLKRNIYESREAVLAEARAAARLNHANICTVYAVEEEAGLPVIAMEYLQGRPLADLLADGIDAGQAVDFARQIATGLAEAHRHAVVHGDLKPANIIVTESTVAKILDFGLARSGRPVHDTQPRVVTGQSSDGQARSPNGIQEVLDETVDSERPGSESQGIIRGTPAYMSPEQARGVPATVSSDVFAFGLILYELLTAGRPALADLPLMELLRRLQDENLGPSLAVAVDEKQRPLLDRMLVFDPDQRPPMGEVVELLASARR
jgi:alkyl hydroperoxide reductase subunit AhpC/predicted Ser/Thr protein kinase